MPTHAMYGLAQVLKDIGIDVISLVNYALNLHDYHYNGFEPGFSRYSKKEEVFRDLITLVKETRKVIDIYYSKYEVKEILGKINELIKELTEGNK